MAFSAPWYSSSSKGELRLELGAGFAIRYKAWPFDYTWVRRSEELDPLAGRNDGAHDFGALAISWAALRE